jgi:enoyl-CoA hydratase/carnithine racemase
VAGGKQSKPLASATMLLHCDLAYAENAVFRMPFVTLGVLRGIRLSAAPGRGPPKRAAEL